MIRLRTSYFAAAWLAACSPVEDNREVDAPGPDTTGPGIAKSTPADMARKVSVLQPLTVVFDEDVDATTVSGATVELFWADDNVPHITDSFDIGAQIGPTMPRHLVPAVVTYDEVSRTMRLVPKAPLPYGQRFTLALSGVKDVAGNPQTTSIKFLTAVNHVTRIRNFDPNAQAADYRVYPLDANGFVDALVTYSDPGVDAIWFNTDDPAATHYDIVAKPNGQYSYEFIMDAGIDTMVNTPDDERAFAFEYKYDTANLPLEQVVHSTRDAGVDMMLGTPDDDISGLISYKSAAGMMSSRIYFTSPGLVDIAWRTADDQCYGGNGALFDVTYDTMGHRSREIHKSCGVDLLPVTPDDVFEQYWDYTWDANHAVTRSVLHTGPGTNGTWLDSDDAIGSTETWTIDLSGLPTEYRFYSGATMTNNDISVRTTWVYNANKQPTLVISHGKGPDSDLGTSDDVIDSYTQTTYDALGNRTRSRTFDVGPDLMAYSGDDRLLADTEFDTTH